MPKKRKGPMRYAGEAMERMGTYPPGNVVTCREEVASELGLLWAKVAELQRCVLVLTTKLKEKQR